MGYRGRAGVFEIMKVTDGIRDLILERRPATTIREAARREGMRVMNEAGVARALDGTTSVDELRRVVFAAID
jgi:type II secretory ATPase GspE/PulE/Tfp pilus assembly ATPase PilB-like protein